jgi:hypothetical protein
MGSYAYKFKKKLKLYDTIYTYNLQKLANISSFKV